MKPLHLISIPLILLLLTAGCAAAFPSQRDFFPSPKDRLDKEPSIVAACEYEWWVNATYAAEVISTADSIIYQNVTPVLWVCYYRDNRISTQHIGNFKDKTDAMSYIWYYYAPHNMPFIKSMYGEKS